jgi:phage replication initiation protein
MAIFVSKKEDYEEASGNISPHNETGGPVGYAGTAGSPIGPPDQRANTQPPITNRGAEITIPPENQSLLDWVAFTFKVNDPREVLDIISLSPSLFSEFQYGFSGYRRSLRFGNISIYYEGREGMGCHVEMSGQGCRQYEAQYDKNPWQRLFTKALAANGSFTRLDLALDNVDGAITLDLICKPLQDHEKQVRTRFGEWRRILKGGFGEGDKVTGETIYLGSSKSHVMFRIYDKAMETGIGGQWMRFELQLREKRAQEAAKLFNSAVSVGSLAVGIINNYFAVINNDDSNISRCTLQPWWSAWLESTEKITLTTEKAVKFVSDSMDFIKRQYAPSLAMINRHLGAAPFREFVREVLEDGRERMGAKHEQILAASSEDNGKRRGKL